MVKKRGIIIQARMGSSRLPSKIAIKLPITSKYSILEQIIRRAKAVDSVDLVAIATSNKPENEPLETMTNVHQVILFRGDEEDVLSRYQAIAEQHQLQTIVRLTGDNPCVDPIYVAQAIQTHEQRQAAYTYTKGLPLGMNIEVISAKALQIAHQQGHTATDREHVTHFFRQNPDKFTVHYPHVLPQQQDYSALRLTIDTPQDYSLMNMLYQQCYTQNELFGFKEIKAFFQQYPWAQTINQHVPQKQQYSSLEDEKIAALALLEKNGFTYTSQYLKND